MKEHIKNRCRICKLHIEGDLEEHMNKEHITMEGFKYVVCKKCYFYTLSTIDNTEALKTHNSEKHFFKYVKPPQALKDERDKQIEMLFKETEFFLDYKKN